MSNYKKDRVFTDFVHKKLALPLIYEPLDWNKVQLKADYAKYIDMLEGIDYVFRKDDSVMSVQERFRDKKYKDFSDFTIRYRRDHNKNKARHKSEYYKMKAHYFTYGIVDCSKTAISESSKFLKYAILDLNKIYAKLDSKAIYISDNKKNKCVIVNGNSLECPIKYNIDKSSSFFPIDIACLVQLWGEDMVISQKGFI